MTEDTRSHIFEPFFTTKEVGKGTGLGLATCYGFIKRCGGFIEVESELGKGTEFKLFLPCADGLDQEGEPIIDSSTSNGGNETVLLVEDEPLIRGLSGIGGGERGASLGRRNGIFGRRDSTIAV
jgi:two-component system cell cycle sensor histidine kinase/response regulator CckA